MVGILGRNWYFIRIGLKLIFFNLKIFPNIGSLIFSFYRYILLHMSTYKRNWCQYKFLRSGRDRCRRYYLLWKSLSQNQGILKWLYIHRVDIPLINFNKFFHCFWQNLIPYVHHTGIHLKLKYIKIPEYCNFINPYLHHPILKIRMNSQMFNAILVFNFKIFHTIGWDTMARAIWWGTP